MIWTRKELKERGLAAFKNNYWRCVIAALILMLITPKSSIGNSVKSLRDSAKDLYKNKSTINKYITPQLQVPGGSLDGVDLSGLSGLSDLSETSDLSGLSGLSGLSDLSGLSESPELSDVPELSDLPNFADLFQSIDSSELLELLAIDKEELSSALKVLFTGILIVTFIGLFIGILIKAFLLNPLRVGVYSFFLENTKKDMTSPRKILQSLQTNYKGTVLTMFLSDLFVFLWSLLFLIPGIVKSYEYRMVPYLLIEHPEMEWRELLQESKSLMDGNKWDAFLLDLSFLGWQILSSLTMNLLGIFYVNPYIQATNVELYRTLSNKNIPLVVRYNENYN